MVSMTQYGVNGITYVCLSTDSKPTDGVPNGACLLTIDNSKIYFFDEANATWREWGSNSIF